MQYAFSKLRMSPTPSTHTHTPWILKNLILDVWNKGLRT